MAKYIPIYETFYTWQGEGAHLGRAAFFIRTYGCPLHCPWCDSAGTWHKDYVPESIMQFTPEELATLAGRTDTRIAVITGGEPTIYDLTALSDALRAKRIAVHLETSGAFPIRGQFDWITVSPKWAQQPMHENLMNADEYKLIITKPDDIGLWWDAIGPFYNGRSIWLHPEWSQRHNPEVLEAISHAVKTRPMAFRAGYQVHKLYNVDALDPSSKPLVPLGGNPELGY